MFCGVDTAVIVCPARITTHMTHEARLGVDSAYPRLDVVGTRNEKSPHRFATISRCVLALRRSIGSGIMILDANAKEGFGVLCHVACAMIDSELTEDGRLS